MLASWPRKTSSPIEGPAPHRRGVDPEGRYDRRREKTWHPADGLARVPVLKNADTTVGAIVDPYGDGEERILATINRRVDVLDEERSRERISEAAYRCGRFCQAIFERLGRTSATSWSGGSRVDPILAQEQKHWRTIVACMTVVELEDRIRGRIGMIDLRLLWF